MGALLWPLFISACEAIERRDRAVAQEVFVGLEKRQRMTNIGRAWLVIAEVWRRVDAARHGTTTCQNVSSAEINSGPDLRSVADDNYEELWRKVSRELDIAVVFG